jgi:hypothetical protein
MSRERTTLVITAEIRAGDISESFLYNPSLEDILFNLRKLIFKAYFILEFPKFFSFRQRANSNRSNSFSRALEEFDYSGGIIWRGGVGLLRLRLGLLLPRVSGSRR